MSIIKKGDKNIEQLLLSELETEVNEVLDFLHQDQNKVAQFNSHLIIVSVLHPSIDCRKQATKLLETDNLKASVNLIKQQLNFLRFVVDEEVETNEAILLEAYKTYNSLRETIEPILLSSPVYSRIYLDAATILIDQKINLHIAETLLESYLLNYKKDETAIILLSRIYTNKSEYDNALKLLRKVVKSNKNSFTGHLEIGFLLEEYFQKYAAAAKHYKLAAALNPDEIIVYVKLAYVYYFFLDNHKESKKYIDNILDLDPYNQYALTILGRIYWEDQGAHTLALETFAKGLNGSKFHHSFLLGTLAEFHVEALGKLDKGKAFYEQALNIEPENKDYLLSYMQLSKKFYNDYGGMKYYYEQYLNQHPTDIEIRMQFCLLILNYIHDLKLARKNLKKILNLDADHAIAKALYEEISD